MNKNILFLLAAVFLTACHDSPAVTDVDANVLLDGMVVDVDTGVDAGVLDSGSDAVVDSGTDSGADAGADSALPDAGIDSGIADSGTPDAGTDSGPVAFCGDGNVDSGEDCDNGPSNAAMSGCETDCSSTRWICGDNETQVFANPSDSNAQIAPNPVACAVVPGSVELFDGDPVALVAIKNVPFPYSFGPSPLYANGNTSLVIWREATIPGHPTDIAFKASACYHIGVTLPHAQCAYLAP